MPQLRSLTECGEAYLEALKKRGSPPEAFVKGMKLYEQFKQLKKQSESLRATRNQKTVEFSKTKDKSIVDDVKKIKKNLAIKEEKLSKVESEIRKIELMLPNWIDSKVPVGKSKLENVPIKYVGVPEVVRGKEGEFENNFGKRPYTRTGRKIHHADLVEKFKMVETENAAKISGSRFYVEQNELVMLDMALSLFTMKEFSKRGFVPLVPPYMMKKEVEEKITYFTSFEESIYNLVEDGLVMITTSEHPLAALYENHIFEKEELPLRLVAFSPAFRREAGAHGKDTKGIFRTHQFHKVELHSMVPVEDQMNELEFLRETVEKVMAPLGFPYQIVKNCAGDMDNRALLQYDLEAWFPAQNNFRELHSIATVGTWISEKLNIKVRQGSEKAYVANLYATGAAIQRTLLAIMVNNYDAEKEIIHIPKPLQGLSGIKTIEKPQ
ncbi:MAG TPA: serine--tRNA ligase [archaeon]|nr:serine--tRNA ligase [archaeon]